MYCVGTKTLVNRPQHRVKGREFPRMGDGGWLGFASLPCTANYLVEEEFEILGLDVRCDAVT
jgi:hypothetical protein